ncbi:MAG: RDD family protein [Chloracidobacterium sp.]|uniref:RDD family protein n=1 Tax=Chloracidobacterium validum TaxID=2821543 RepID=A0ABX8BAR4_9BACT|nr:RDD family protein [Chloracidobacterium validum]QUW03769.1 RDD family protein [Chloracidobacterium validum]
MTWRVVVQGQTYETSLEELRQWVQEGRVLPTDQIFQPGVGWVAAGQVADLQAWFPPGAATLPPPAGFSGSTPGGGDLASSPYASSYAPHTPPLDPYTPAYGQVGGYGPPMAISFGSPASLGKRFLGAFVDGCLTMLCSLPGIILYMTAIAAGVQDGGSVPAGRAAGGYLLIYLGAIAYGLLCAYMLSKSGASPGKKLAGTVVLREDGQYLTFGMAILREFLKNVFSNICFLLILWLLFDSERQQLYDKVVRANVYEAS